MWGLAANQRTVIARRLHSAVQVGNLAALPRQSLAR